MLYFLYVKFMSLPCHVVSLQYPCRAWESWVGVAAPVTWQVSPWLASQVKHQTCLVREEFSLKYDNGKNAIST